ncbi:MAG TPA: lipopolysaccharide biosynthesis protein [Clostridia bacterium]|nr:lipopolysaccharide biosynthesis protein [Clostridia bacterium]
MTQAAPAIPSVSIDLADLKRKSVRGGMITFASQGVSVVIQLTSTVILARLLSPADYGVMAMVVAVTAFAGLFRDLGLSSAAIQKQLLTHSQQSSLFWINVALGTALTGLLAGLSPVVSWFYQQPEVLWVTIAMSGTFLISSLSTQSGASLLREMRFGRQSMAGIAGALITMLVAVGLATHGFRYWSLVWGQIAGAITTTSLLILLSPFRPGPLHHGEGLKEILRFGANVTAFDLVNYFHRNLDNLLIGRFWGSDALGFYSRAYTLLMFPISSFRGPINAVAFPAMSKLQGEPQEFRSYYLQVTSLIAFLSMPCTAFLFVASSPVIELTLGKQWLGVVPIFSWLAIAAFIQPAFGFVGSFLLSAGNGRRYLECGCFNALLITCAFLIGIRWGALGVAMAYALANYVIIYPSLSWAFQGSSVCFGDFVEACSWPAITSLIAAGIASCVMNHLTMFHPAIQVSSLLAIFSTVIGSALLFTSSGRRYRLLFAGVIRTLIKMIGKDYHNVG